MAEPGLAIRGAKINNDVGLNILFFHTLAFKERDSKALEVSTKSNEMSMYIIVYYFEILKYQNRVHCSFP